MKIIDKKLLKSNIEEIANYDLSENNVFGSAYLVSQNGEVVYENYFGVTDEAGSAVNSGTIFRLASMTKPITAIAVMILIDRGILSLEDDVKKYLPEFENLHIITKDGTDLGKAKVDIKIWNLLTHTSGFGALKELKLSEEERKTCLATIDAYIKAGLDFEAGEKQSYNAYAAFDVLVAIVEKVTGEDYEEFLQKEIFAPLGMCDTTFIPTESQEERIISMHNKEDGKSVIGKTTPGCIFNDFPYRHKLGGAGLVSTLPDYAKFAKMLLGRGKFEDKTIVSEETFALMPKSYVPYELMPWTNNWGLGVRVVSDSGYKPLPVGCFGWSGAYGPHFWIDPENQITAVFMKNSRFDGGSGNSSACRFEEAVMKSLK